MTLGPFIVGGNTGDTPQSIARKREFAARMMYGSERGQARNVGEGWGNAIASITRGLAARSHYDQATAAEAAGQQQANAIQQQFYQYLTGGAPAAGTTGSAPASAPIEPQAGEGALPGLAESRARYAEELKDPAVAARFAGLIQAEVGGQGPQAQQAFAESTFNRASARGQTLDQVMQGGYFPGVTHERAAQYAADPKLAQRYQQMLAGVLGGSNVANYATGNASGTVGFNGGPQVSAFGGERFGIEGPDMAWVKRMRGGQQVASADPGFAPGLPAGADPLPPRPGSQPAPGMASAAPQQMAQAAPPAPPAPSQPGAMPPSRDLTPLVQAATNPWVPEEMRQAARTMLQQEMQQRQQAQDPMRQLQMQKLQQDLAGKPTSDIQEYEYARQQGFRGTFQDYQVMLKEAGRPSTSVNIDQKVQGALEKTLGESVGKTFGGMYDEGASSGQDLYQIDRLRGLLGQSGSGLGPALTNLAAGFGIKLGDGADAGQAADAIISYLTPRMRVPGSGSSSDKDLALFRRSLPRLMNTPEGNNLILDTMQGLAEYKRAQGDIAGQVVMGELDPKEAVKMIRALPDPFAQFRAGSQQPGGMSKADYDALPSGAEFTAPDGSRRRKP